MGRSPAPAAAPTSPVEPAVDALVRSGLVDVGWVSAQLGEPVRDAVDAARHALAGTVSPHPLLEPAWLTGADGDGGPGAALAAYVTEPSGTAGHPFVDIAAARAQLGTPPGDPDPVLADWLRTAEPGTPLPTRRLPRTVTWGEYREAALRAAAGLAPAGLAPGGHAPDTVAPDAPPAGESPAPGTRSDVSVVLPLPAGPRRLLEWVATTSDPGVEVVLGAAGASRAARLLGGTVAELLPGVRVADLPADAGPQALLNACAARSHGSVLVLARGGTHPPEPGLAPLVAAVGDGVAAAQPLVLDAERLVQSAGAVLGPDGPSLLLAGHPAHDAVRLGTVRIPAAAGAVVAVRRDAWDAVGGLDESWPVPYAETDLTLRTAAAGLGGTVLVPHVHVRNDGRYGAPRPTQRAAATLRERHDLPTTDLAALLAPVGLAPAEDATAEVPLRALRGIHEEPPRLRWALDIASPAGPHGDDWGDTAFARSLAAALGRLGQHVAVDHSTARGRATRSLDDVVLALRGLEPVTPRPGPLSVVWVISHPDAVDGDELARHDLRYAASHAWSRTAADRWGLPVTPLLQCTDPARFRPADADSPGLPEGPDVLFVGNSRGVLRPVVRDALAVGADLTLYGKYWEGLVPAGLVAAEHVPNEHLGALYASAGVVLADHFEDMRAEGFVANRLFDAAACGARVVSDRVAGADDALAGLGGLVRFYDSADDLRRLLEGRREEWPDAAARRAAATEVAARHSFDARARTLLDDVVRALRAREADAPGR